MGNLPSRAPEYTADELEQVKHYNKEVPLYQWIGLMLIFGSAILLHLISNIQSKIRRRRAATYAGSLLYPPKRRRPSERIVWSCVFAAATATVNKYIGKKVPLLHKVHISTVGQLSLMAAVLLAVFTIVFTGARNEIDYIAHHSARTCNALMPLIIALAGKNNLISYITGYSYEALNLFHRWTGRLVLLLAAIHISGRVYVNVPNIELNKPNPSHGEMVKWGLGALAGYVMVNLTGNRWFRSRFFSLFMLVHVCSVFLMIACLIKHYHLLDRWVYAALGLYLLDHCWRAGRLLYYNGIRNFRKGGIRMSHVEALTSDTMRVVVKTRMTWVAGSHCYLHLPFLSSGGHPFSLSSISHPMTQLDNRRPELAQHEFIVRVRGGLTKRLYQVCIGEVDPGPAPDGKPLKPLVDNKYQGHEIYAFTEGPYGLTQTLGEDAETVLLFCGGSGVSYTISVMMELVRRARALALGRANMAVCCQRIVFVWSVKDAEHIKWLDGKLQEAVSLAPPGLLKIKIFVTRMPKDKIPKNRISQQILPPRMQAKVDEERAKNPKTASLPAVKTTLSPGTPSKTFVYSPSAVPSPNTPANNPFLDPNAKEYSPADEKAAMEWPQPKMPNIPLKGGAADDSDHSYGGRKKNKPTPHQRAYTEPIPNSATVTPLEINSGRPDMAAIIEEEIQNSAVSDWVQIGFCGPSPMASNLETAVANATKPSLVLRGEMRRAPKLYLEVFD